MQQLSELATQKTFLCCIVENKYELPEEVEPFALLKAMLPNLGSTDEELRDLLTYPIMAEIIMSEQERYHLTGAQMEELLLMCIDQEHLFSGIGETGTDSVFMRTFTCLMFPLLLIADANRLGVSESTVRRVLEALLTYARQERDWRGYVKGKGWAHSVAHLSDAFDDCAKNRFMKARDCKIILETLTYLAQLPEPLYHEEDARLAFTAYGIIARQTVELPFLKKWIASLVVAPPTGAPDEDRLTIMYRASNARNFLRSLYFLLAWSKVSTLAEQKAELLAEIDLALQKLNSLPAEWLGAEDQE